MPVARSGNIGAIAGGSLGFLRGAVSGYRDIKDASFTGKVHLDAGAFRHISQKVLVNTAAGALVGFSIGQLGDWLLTGDGALGTHKKLKEVRTYAREVGLDPEATRDLLDDMRSAVRDARTHRLSSAGNRVFRRDGLGFFARNPVSPIPSSKDLDDPLRKVLLAVDSLSTNASPTTNLLLQDVSKNPELLDIWTKVVERRHERATDALNTVFEGAEALLGSDNPYLRNLGAFAQQHGPVLSRSRANPNDIIKADAGISNALELFTRMVQEGGS